MVIDRDLAASVRTALAGTDAVREVKMFGGIGFMLNGNLLAAASGRGLLVRVGNDRQRDALTREGARPMEMKGRTMEGYIYVDPAALNGCALEEWLQLAVSFVRTLPPKPLGPKPDRAKGKRK